MQREIWSGTMFDIEILIPKYESALGLSIFPIL